MRKTFHCIALALMAGVISFSSCTQAEIEGTQGIVVTPMFKTVISATTPGNPQTRINFEDEGGSGVALAWETGDMLVAYKGDTKAAVFHYTGGNGASSGTFEAQTSDELEGDYTLIYTTFSENAHESNIDKMRNKIKNRPVVQVGSGSTAHLKNNVLMEASYIVGESAAFSHKMALMTVNVKKPADNNLLSKVDKPIIMTLEEDYSTLYSLHLSGMDWNSEFKVYFFVEPRSSERRFEFTIHTNNGFYLSGAVKTGYTYTEGYRYTAILDENFFMSSGYINLYQLKGFCYCDLEGDIWVFSTRNSDNGDDDDWQRLRESIQFWSSPVTVIFPDIKILPEGAFDGCTNLTAVYSPLMEDYIKANSFRNCSSLQDVNLPLAKGVQANAFEGCSSLLSIDLPEATEVLENAFMNCTSIQSIKLPKLLRLRNASFQNCVALNNLYLATETSNTIENVFQVRPFLSIDGINDYSLIDVNLYLSKSEFEGTYHWDNRPNIVGNTWKEFGPFKSINVVE